MLVLVEGHSPPELLRELVPKAILKRGFSSRSVGHFRCRSGIPAVILPKLFSEHPIFDETGIDPGQLPNLNRQSSLEALFSLGCSTEAVRSIVNLSVLLNRALRRMASGPAETGTPKILPGSDRAYLAPVEALEEIVSLQKRYGPLGHMLKRSRRAYRGRVDWRKTLLKSSPSPGEYHLPFVSTSADLSLDEPLYELLYATLDEAVRKYGYSASILRGNAPGNGAAFKAARRQARRTLRKTKAAYYSDSERQLHRLLCSYYMLPSSGHQGERSGGYLIATIGSSLWESILDDLLSDRPVKEELQFLPDGRRLDHIFVDRLPIVDDGSLGLQTAFIGDAKYYSSPLMLADPTKPASYKQAGYVHAVYGHHVDRLLGSIAEDECRWFGNGFRDPTGINYLPIPSFFVFAANNPDHNARNLETWLDYGHYDDRLFDRDTVSIGFFALDFRRVLRAYVIQRSELMTLSVKVRALIRDGYENHYRSSYRFLRIAHPRAEELFYENLALLWGRVFFLDDRCTEFIFASSSAATCEVVRNLFADDDS